MRIPRNISGRLLTAALTRQWGYKQVHQSGSHIILQTEEPSHQRLAVPDHKNLRVGTLNNILRAVASHKGVLRETILESL